MTPFPGYYQALDLDGEYHLCPITNDAETLEQSSEQMRAVWGALCLHQAYLMKAFDVEVNYFQNYHGCLGRDKFKKISPSKNIVAKAN